MLGPVKKPPGSDVIAAWIRFVENASAIKEALTTIDKQAEEAQAKIDEANKLLANLESEKSAVQAREDAQNERRQQQEAREKRLREFEEELGRKQNDLGAWDTELKLENERLEKIKAEQLKVRNDQDARKHQLDELTDKLTAERNAFEERRRKLEAALS